jgi:predicted glycoside hydrolase/deacetylase ChbG (UPF0249 family)
MDSLTPQLTELNEVEPTTRLIVNGDDFGLTPGINEAVRRLHRKGRLSSVSLLTNAPWSAEAMAYAGRENDLPVGVHLNLTINRPLLPADRVPTLITPEGKFHNTSAFVLRLVTGRIDQAEMEAELSAQIEACLQAGIRPTHVDTHMHLHALPSLRSLVCRLTRQFGIETVRNARVSDIVVPPLRPGRRSKRRSPSKNFGNLREVKAKLAQPPAGFPIKSSALFRRHGDYDNLKTTDRVLVLRYCLGQGSDPLSAFQSCLWSLQGHTVEVVAHPAIEDEHLPALSSYVNGRQRELEFLESDDFARWLDEGLVTLA